jgi:hypothetical protein
MLTLQQSIRAATPNCIASRTNRSEAGGFKSGKLLIICRKLERRDRWWGSLTQRPRPLNRHVCCSNFEAFDVYLCAQAPCI